MAGNRRALLVLVAIGASSVAIPWAIVTCCLDGPKSPPSAHYWMGTPAVLSWSLPSTALRMLDPPSHGTDMPENWLRGNDPVFVLPAAHRLVSVAIAATTVLCGVLALGLACRWNLDRRELPWAMAAMTSLVLAAAPICWTHYQVMQYPGVALLLAAFAQDRKWALAGLVELGLGALLYPVPVAVLRSYYEHYGAWTAASPATLYFWTSVTPIVCLELCLVSGSDQGAPRYPRDVDNRSQRAQSGGAQKVRFRSELPQSSAEQRAGADDHVADQIVGADRLSARVRGRVLDDERLTRRNRRTP